jgi:hypothetical protein
MIAENKAKQALVPYDYERVDLLSLWYVNTTRTVQLKTRLVQKSNNFDGGLFCN